MMYFAWVWDAARCAWIKEWIRRPTIPHIHRAARRVIQVGCGVAAIGGALVALPPMLAPAPVYAPPPVYAPALLPPAAYLPPDVWPVAIGVPGGWYGAGREASCDRRKRDHCHYRRRRAERPVPTPEPASLALLGVGLLGLAVARGRRP
ncbi:MAG: PEP-CTERM sorting domain-containing protein [Acetobacteraceae bacterium]